MGMSEEETIKRIEESLKLTELCQRTTNAPEISANYIWDMRTLLDLYNKEKEKNKKLEIELEIKKYCKVDELATDLIYYKNLAKEYQGNCISKDKIKDKIEIYRMAISDSKNGDFIHDVRQKIQVLKELLESEN